MAHPFRMLSLSFVLGVFALASHAGGDPATDKTKGHDSHHSTGSTMRDGEAVDEAADAMGTPAWLAAHRARFDHCDTDDDGVISKAELDAMDDDSLVLGQFDRDDSQTITRAEWDARGDSLDRFARADADHDGTISRDELARLGDTRMSFADIDSDRDGTVSSAEWDNHGLNTDDE